MSEFLQEVEVQFPYPVLDVRQMGESQEILVQLPSAKIAITSNKRTNNIILKTQPLNHPKEKLVKAAADNNLCVSNHCMGVSLAAKISQQEKIAGVLESFERAISRL